MDQIEQIVSEVRQLAVKIDRLIKQVAENTSLLSNHLHTHQKREGYIIKGLLIPLLVGASMLIIKFAFSFMGG